MRSTEEKPAALEEEIIRGLMLMLSQTFELKEGENLFYSPTSLKALQAHAQKLKQTGKSLSFPLMYVKISNVNRSVQTQAFNPKSLARHGVYVRTDDKDQKFARKLNLIRTDLEFELAYLVEDQRKALAFTSSWVSLGLNNRLNFTVNYYGVGIDIACRLSESVAVPEKETSVDEALNVYEFSASIVVEGYVTAQHVDEDSNIPMVNKISVGTNPILDGADIRNPRVLNQALAYRRN